MKYICVYCGSRPGNDAVYVEAARCLAASMVRRNLGLVYGGASIGVMGAVADEVLRLGGSAVGVIPESLMTQEVAHSGLTELLVTSGMHERKTLMADRADGFVALPGGLGTLEEIFEILTWAQLRFHAKPCGLLNVNGYFDHLIAFLDHAVDQQFVSPAHRDYLRVGETPDSLLDELALG